MKLPVSLLIQVCFILITPLLSTGVVLADNTVDQAVQPRLTYCPDCGGKVSCRALICPHCGCPGEAIQVAANSNHTEQVRIPSFCYSLVSVVSDQGTGVGVCIQSGGQLYVLTSQSTLAGAETLTLSSLSDGSPIPYSAIDLASDRNIVRLAVTSTNLQPLEVSTSSSADFTLVHVATSNTVALVPVGSLGTSLPMGSPLLDSATNLVMLIPTAGSKHGENVNSVESWVPVQPQVYRTQTKLLQQARKPIGDRAALVKQLQETKWLTPYLAKNAKELVGELQQQE